MVGSDLNVVSVSVLSCNQYTTRGDFPKNYDAIQGHDSATVISRGGSCIVNPMGQFLAGPDFDGETILTAELDMNDITRGKYDFDVTDTTLALMSSNWWSTKLRQMRWKSSIDHLRNRIKFLPDEGLTRAYYP